ncbi:MAG: CD225/dispanin family protein [Lacinutrix sp.]|uniref:CD225/dispanin family protein n=1 Tax=Lacinutrix sp. TaxID=1937692 RepID=UPI00309A4AF2
MEQIVNNNKPPRPSNYLALAIISTIACCMPLGIVSIIYSTKVDSAYNDGNYELAESSSKKAKNWGIAGLSTGVIAIVLYLIFIVFLAAVGALDA